MNEKNKCCETCKFWSEYDATFRESSTGIILTARCLNTLSKCYFLFTPCERKCNKWENGSDGAVDDPESVNYSNNPVVIGNVINRNKVINLFRKTRDPLTTRDVYTSLNVNKKSVQPQINYLVDIGVLERGGIRKPEDQKGMSYAKPCIEYSLSETPVFG